VQDLVNYVYMPLWLVITLTLMAGIGFEFLVYRVIRLINRILIRRSVEPAHAVVGSSSIVLLRDHLTKKARKSE
jgi:hypothetical protein